MIYGKLYIFTGFGNIVLSEGTPVIAKLLFICCKLGSNSFE